MAKKNDKNTERRAMVEKMRAEQARKERTRSLLILGACVVVVAALIGSAAFVAIKDHNDKESVRKTALAKLGVSRASAGCLPVKTKAPTGVEASGVNGNHVADGTTVKYADSPPAYGQHWGTFLTSNLQRNFWAVADRPPLSQMVHSEEHGHTYLWYDDTIKEGSAEYKTLQNIADKFEAKSDLYFNVVPWTKSDGGDFPSGKHVALTHWTSDSDGKQSGVWEYCSKASGEVVSDFTDKYPASDAPEAGAE